MKTPGLILVLLFFCSAENLPYGSPVYAGESLVIPECHIPTIPVKTESIDSVRDHLERVLRNYYQTMSDRNWEAYREFFWPDATLTTAWQARGDVKPRVHVTTIDDFIAGTAEGPDSQPIFEEKPISIEIDVRGSLAVAWVSYEARFGSEEHLMEWNGIDVFTLMQHEDEWRIVSLAYSSEG
ncbi:MAG: nuclear transport factor 2 family protein [Cyclobacteriaceae bacterium]